MERGAGGRGEGGSGGLCSTPQLFAAGAAVFLIRKLGKRMDEAGDSSEPAVEHVEMKDEE